MKKITQNVDELLASLSQLDTDWKDEFASSVLSLLADFSVSQEVEEDLIIRLLETDFEAASTLFRLFLEMSKDEYMVVLKSIFSNRGMHGKKGFQTNKRKYAAELDHLLIREKITDPAI